MRTIIPLLLFFLHASPLSAQPVLNAIWPLSCRSGESVEVQVSGKKLEKTAALVFSQPGISAEAFKGGKFRVSVPAEIAPQECDVWCVTAEGISNPRRFVVASQPCAAEQAGNDSPETAQAVPLPGAVDGRLSKPAEVDWYQFTGERRQSVTLICRSLSLDGSVEPSLTVVGPNGRELAHSSGRRREPVVTLELPADGTYRVSVCDRAYRQNDHSHYRLELLTGARVLGCLPEVRGDGHSPEVTLFGYGLAEPAAGHIVGSRAALTHVTAPLASNADSGPLAWQPAGSPLTFRSLTLPEAMCGQARLAVESRRVVLEMPALETQDERQTPESPQPIEIPALVVGTFDSQGDLDSYAFSAKKGDSLNVRIHGDRLGHQMDVDAAILDAGGKTLVTFPDAGVPKGFPPELAAASLDVSATWKVPANGEYRLLVRDQFGSLAGTDRSYIIELDAGQPSCVVYAVPAKNSDPSALTLPTGGSVECSLFAVRHGGFKGAIEIELDVEDQAAHVVLEPCQIAADKNDAKAKFSAKPEAALGTHLFRLRARTEIDGNTVESPVRIVTSLTDSSVRGRLVDRGALLVLKR